MVRYSFSTLLLVSAVFVAVACAERKQLADMHEATLDMRENTEEIRKNSETLSRQTDELGKKMTNLQEGTERLEDLTGKVGQTSEEISKTGCELYDASRQGVSMGLRNDLLEALLRSESSGDKLRIAAQYFDSFEFQLWNGTCRDAQDGQRQILMANAMSEVFKMVREFLVEGTEPDPFAQKGLFSESNKQSSFNAVALAMSEMNRKQADGLKDDERLAAVSVYSMVVESLRLEKEVNDGQIALNKLTAYQRTVLANRDIAVRLLQARHNFAATVFLSEVLPKTGLMNKLRAGGNYYLNIALAWDLDLDRYGLVQLDTLGRYLAASLDTRKDLVEIGESPAVNQTVATFFESMRVKTAGKAIQLKAEGTGSAGAMANARLRLAGLIEDFRKSPILAQ